MTRSDSNAREIVRRGLRPVAGERQRVIVVGAGMAGLSAAFELMAQVRPCTFGAGTPEGGGGSLPAVSCSSAKSAGRRDRAG